MTNENSNRFYSIAAAEPQNRTKKAQLRHIVRLKILFTLSQKYSAEKVLGQRHTAVGSMMCGAE